MPEKHYIRVLKTVEWLFKQSNMGGEEHIIVGMSLGDTICSSISLANQFTHIHTLCGKILRFNETWSVIRRRSGAIRNLCLNCLMENGQTHEVNIQKFDPEIPF